MGNTTWCDVCLRVTKEPLTKHQIPLDKPLIFSNETAQIHATEQWLCPECSRFMEAVTASAKHWAHELLVSLRQVEQPDVRVTESLLPGDDEGDWAYLVQFDEIASEKLDLIKIVWKDYPYESMTLSEYVKRRMQEDKQNDGDLT